MIAGLQYSLLIHPKLPALRRRELRRQRKNYLPDPQLCTAELGWFHKQVGDWRFAKRNQLEGKGLSSTHQRAEAEVHIEEIGSRLSQATLDTDHDLMSKGNVAIRISGDAVQWNRDHFR